MSYRMRADAHYVESLDSESVAPPIRYLDASVIESSGDDAVPATDFVESIRRHGVLQPLLVRGRAGRYRVIAGRKRLAAALATGLRRVPCVVQRVDDDEASSLCVVQRVDDDEASSLAVATNLPSESARPKALVDAVPVEAVMHDLSTSLTALLSSVNLWSEVGIRLQLAASDLVKAEAARALRLLWALRTVRSDTPLHTCTFRVGSMLEQVGRVVDAERRLRDVALVVDSTPWTDASVTGDRDQLSEAVAALVCAGWTIFETSPGDALSIRVDTHPARDAVFEVSRAAFTMPEGQLTAIFEAPRPVSGGDSALALLQAAQRVARAHGGHTAASTGPAGTALALVIPQRR